MLRDDSVHTWWIASLATIAFVYSCAKEGAEPAPVDDMRAQNDASAPDRDAAPSEDAAADNPTEDAASSSACAEPIPSGDLQDQASGPSVFGQIVSAALGSPDAPGDSACGAEGVRICLFDTETCTESDDAGQFVLEGLPEDSDIEISFEKAGYFSALRLAHLQNLPIDLRETRFLRESDRRTLQESLGLDGDSHLGGLVAVPIIPGEAIGSVSFPEGVKITLMPGDIEPYYSRGILEPGGLSSDELDPALEATQNGGWALFPEVEAGDYTLHFERDGAPCSFIPGFGFGADELGDIRVRIRDGFNTATIAALCP